MKKGVLVFAAVVTMLLMGGSGSHGKGKGGIGSGGKTTTNDLKVQTDLSLAAKGGFERIYGKRLVAKGGDGARGGRQGGSSGTRGIILLSSGNGTRGGKIQKGNSVERGLVAKEGSGTKGGRLLAFGGHGVKPVKGFEKG